jgi:hypothetical protein
MIGIGLVASTVAVLAVAATARAHDRVTKRAGGLHPPSLPMMTAGTTRSGLEREPEARSPSDR